MLAQQREDRVVCVALHARSEQTEVPDVVPVAVGDVIGQDSQELAWRVGGLDYLFSARGERGKAFVSKGMPSFAGWSDLTAR